MFACDSCNTNSHLETLRCLAQEDEQMCLGRGIHEDGRGFILDNIGSEPPYLQIYFYVQ